MRACAKINLGLNVVSRRNDGYHNIETVFLPLPLYDTITLTVPALSSPKSGCHLTVAGTHIDCDSQHNLVVRAYNLLAQEFALPPVHVVLEKHIPVQAGLGGGSSDAAHMLRLLNEQFALHLTSAQLIRCAGTLGADCAFFIEALPAYAEGIGDKLYPMPGLCTPLLGRRLALVKAPINISTREAFSHLTPHSPSVNCLETVLQPMETWRDTLVNDFEQYVCSRYVALQEIKNTLYRMGAQYVSLTGSGSAIYAFFPSTTTVSRLSLRRIFPECYTTLLTIKEPSVAANR